MNALESMIFYPSWRKCQFREAGFQSEGCVWLFFESQRFLASQVEGFIGGSQVCFLSNSVTPAQLASRLENFDRIVFVAETAWSYNVNYDEISSFLALLKVIQQVRCTEFDIVTVRSITCSAFRAVTHPHDGVFVGLGQTFAQEVDFSVRVLVLERISEKVIYWVLHGTFPSRYPIVVLDDCFLIPTLKRNAAYSRTVSHRKSSYFRTGGTYLVIGGRGGLGGMLAKYLARQYKANLILIGRSPRDQKQLDNLVKNGAASASYEQSDVSDFEKMKAIFKRHPGINGIVHSALVLKDSLICNMSDENLQSVLSPKLCGTLNLLRILRNMDCSQLDFVLFFSSVQSYIANPGQANYTAACVSKDALANILRELYMVNSKIINWSFWGDIGVVASDYYRKRMSKLGIESIKEEEGLEIIEWFLSTKIKQVTVIKASDNALKRLNIEG
ncbi:MAG: SDR family NAD(P)-dependent oxidoreductase [Alphaproteobacteria bacterium]|nr:SDR family NAD(P)-dependent oxidoreductase [Alphaproteobacteria bacterium]